MKYQSLMVYLDLGQCNESALRIAMKSRLDASLMSPNGFSSTTLRLPRARSYAPAMLATTWMRLR